jgi:hypothetical protein
MGRPTSPARIHYAEDVDVELFLNLLAGNRLEDSEQTETGVVDQGVDPAEPLHTVRNGRVNALSVLDIQTRDQYAGQAAQFRIRRRLAHGRNDVPVVARKNPRCRQANACGSSRDQNCFLHTAASSQAFAQKALIFRSDAAVSCCGAIINPSTLAQM